MSLTITKTSGSVEEFETDAAVPVENGDDLLKECAGGCGQKILCFGPGTTKDWGTGVEGALCLECVSQLFKHVPRRRKNDDGL